MGMIPIKLLIAGLGFFVILLSGYALRRTGQPFPATILTAHKLVTVATIAFLVKTVLEAVKLAPLAQAERIAGIAAGAFFLLAIASGGWLSAVKEMPAFVRAGHLILSLLTVLSSAVFLYLLYR